MTDARKALESAREAELQSRAWNCDEWPDWLHVLVNRTNEVADRHDMSSEQAHAYAILAALASGEQGWRTDMATLPRDATILIAVERRNGQPMFGDRQRETYPAYVDEAKRLCDARTCKPDPGFSGEHFRTVAWRPLPVPPAPETRS